MDFGTPCLYACPDIYDKVIVVGDAYRGDVEFVVFYRDMLHRIFQRQHRVGVGLSLLFQFADADIFNLAGQEKAVADKDGILTQLDIAEKRRDKEIQRKKVGGNKDNQCHRLHARHHRAGKEQEDGRYPYRVEKTVDFWLVDFIQWVPLSLVFCGVRGGRSGVGDGFCGGLGGLPFCKDEPLNIKK